MKTTDKNPSYVSNERFYLSPHAYSTILFEQELNKRNIKYSKNDLAILQPYIVFSFLKKDLDIVTNIFDKIQQEEFGVIDYIKKGKKKKRKTIEHRQKTIVKIIFLLIVVIIVLVCFIK
ncbi:MAG: hypothetical protein LBV75_05720 [Paludibacter sp.]|jgi:hypothetical protein|nr:hypothetical protein [Paludibacter sp.]